MSKRVTTGCGSFPADWRVVALGEVCDVVSGQVNPTLPEYRDLPHVNGQNIESGTGRLLEVNTAAEDGMASGKYLFAPGDVLYSKLRPYLRKVVLVDFQGVCSADMYPLRPHPDVLDPEFFKWLLLSDDFTRYADEESRRARMPKLNREQLFGWLASLPPLAEQQRIAGILKEQLAAVEQACAAAEAQLEAAQALPAAYLREVLSSAESAGWPVKRLGDVLTGIEAGKCVSCVERPADLTEWGVLKVSAVTWGTFKPEENKVLPDGFEVPADREVRAGDFLISRSNTTELVGAVVHVKQTRPRLMLSDKTLRLVPRDDEILPEYMELALRSPQCRSFIEEKATGASSSMKNITQDTIRDIPLPVPPINQQRRIMAKVSRQLKAAEPIRAAVEEQLVTIHRMPVALLGAAFQGQI